MTIERIKETAAGISQTKWATVAIEVKNRITEEHLTLLAAGLGYYGLLAMVPALVALVSIYGLIADPADVARVIESISAAVPNEVTAFVDGQLRSIIEAPSSGLGLSAAISLAAALWAASSGTSALIRGVNIAFRVDESRNAVRRRLVSLASTIGLAAFIGSALLVLSAGRSLFGGALEFLRWPLLLVGTIVGLGILYRVGPAVRPPGWKIASIGAVVAALMWLMASFGLSIYVSSFGSFNETYGTLGAVIVTMIWLFVSGLVVLIGAVLDGTLRDHRSRQ